MMVESSFQAAWADLRDGFKQISLAGMLGWQDVVRRYRRSRIGAFWLSINIVIMIGAIGTIFGALFKSPIETFLPHLAVGLVLWTFISSTIMELSLCFISSEGMILQIKMPLTVHLLRVMVRNLVVLLHNIVIIPIVMVFFKVSVGWDALLLIPGIALLILALFPIGLISSIFCSRFRDMSQVVQNILQLSFYATPIMWFASALPGGAYNLVLLLNPFYHLLAVIRGPLLGEPVEIISWIICLCLVLVSWITAFIFFARYQKRIPFWL